MTEHHKYAASAAHRWAKCTASHKLESEIPSVSSSYAKEGQDAHAIAAYLLLGGELTSGEKLSYNDGKDLVIVSAEMLESIAPYIEFITNMIAKGATRLQIEHSADIITGLLGGTTDAIFLRRDTLHICDLKYGRGVVVEPKENAQLLCYALANLPDYPEAKQVCLNIIQPRAQGEIVKQWRCSVEYVQEFGKDIRQTIAEIEANQTYFGRGEHCQFCKVLHSCPSYFNVVDKIASDTLDLVPSALVTEKQRAYILEHIEEIRALCSAIEKNAETRLRSGEKIEGWKLVNKIPRAKWIADALEQLRGTELVTETLIGITEAKKILGSEIEKYTVKESSGVVMVRTADKQPEIAAGAMLDEITEE